MIEPRLHNTGVQWELVQSAFEWALGVSRAAWKVNNGVMDLDALVPGFFGGAMLGIARMVRSLPLVMTAREMKAAQFIGAHCLIALCLGLMGAVVVWALEGRASAFIEGIGALSFLTLLTTDSESNATGDGIR